jgi:hypothetical protein
MIIVWSVIILTLAFGCATTKQPTIYMEPGPVEEWTAPNGMGWQPLTESGYLWVYRTEQGIQASCSYQFMKVQDVEMWKGEMIKMQSDFMGGTQTLQESGLENLAGCVEWVNHHLLGGYYL